MNEEIKCIKDLLKVITELGDKVFIVGHNNADLDSLASAIGLQTLCEFLGKEAYIVLDESETTIEPIVKKLRDDNISAHNIITMDGFQIFFNDESSLIVTDTNKTDKVCVKDYLDEFKKIIIIDHHGMGETTIKNASYYIPMIKEEEKQANGPKVKVSSASEIVAQLLLQAKVDCSKDVYTYLYGGIYLDTDRFDKNVGEKTHDTTHKLCAKGADRFQVKEYFLADFDEDKAIYNLIFNGSVLRAIEYDIVNNYTVGFTLNREKPTTIYKREQLAKTADRTMQYRIEAEFALGYIDDETIAVSARSRGKIDVGKIMEQFGGGGNSQNAATQVKVVDNVESKPIDEMLQTKEKRITELEELLYGAVKKGFQIDGELVTPVDTTVISAPKQYVKK